MKSSLPIRKAKDVLAWVLENKQSNQKVVGFAAETNFSHKQVTEKWNKKPVHLLVGTFVNNGLTGDKQEGFQNAMSQHRWPVVFALLGAALFVRATFNNFV